MHPGILHLLRLFLVQSWDETTRSQQLAAKPSQIEHTCIIGPVAAAPAAPIPMAL